jgi:hypothetical protein
MSCTVYQPGYHLGYDAQSGKLSIDGHGNTVTIKTPNQSDDRDSVTMFTSGTINMPEGKFSINGNDWTKQEIVEWSKQQSEFIEAHRGKCEPGGLEDYIKECKTNTGRFLIMLGNLPQQMTCAIAKSIAMCIEDPSMRNFAWITILQTCAFSQSEINAAAMATIPTADNMRILTSKNPPPTRECLMAIYKGISDDCARGEALAWIVDAKTSWDDTYSLYACITTDMYKIDAIRAILSHDVEGLRPPSTPQTIASNALSLINGVTVSTYKVDAISALGGKLRGITPDQRLALINTLNSAYVGDAMRALPAPERQAPAEAGAAPAKDMPDTAPAVHAFDTVIKALRATTWDENKTDILRQMLDGKAIAIRDVVAVLRLYKWDEGRLDALRLMRQSIPDDWLPHITDILATFKWDEGKVDATRILTSV